MEVLYWQVFVVLTVAGSYLFLSRKMALIVAGLWSIFTLAVLYYAPLIVLQIIVAWGTFLVIDRLKKSSSELSETQAKVTELELALAGLPTDVQVLARAAETRGQVVPLKDSEHYDYLIDAIGKSKNSILILSGWLSSSVVDHELIGLLRGALEMGVNVYLGYGYADSSGKHEPSHKTQIALDSLRQLSNSASGMQGVLKVGEFNNHQKILIRDCEVVCCGSHNWLSNRAMQNREQSFIVNDDEVARLAFAQCRPLIESNLKV